MGGDRDGDQQGVSGDDRHPFVAARLGQYRGLVAELKTARAWGVPLSRLRTWSLHDYTLAVALQMHEDDLCPSCGHSMSETSKNLYTVPAPSRCGACDALQMAEERGTYKSLPRPGALRFSTVVIPPESLKPRPWQTPADEGTE